MDEAENEENSHDIDQSWKDWQIFLGLKARNFVTFNTCILGIVSMRHKREHITHNTRRSEE